LIFTKHSPNSLNPKQAIRLPKAKIDSSNIKVNLIRPSGLNLEVMVLDKMGSGFKARPTKGIRPMVGVMVSVCKVRW
jgi:hypothetical protein